MCDGWTERLSKLLSDAVLLEHKAFYFYLAAGAHFESPKMSLLNLKDFFYKESNDELLHAKMVIEFMNQRGLSLKLENISTIDPSRMQIREIFEIAEKTEQQVLEHYLCIQKEASDTNDFVTTQFIDYFIDKQIGEVKEFHDRAMNARRCESPLGQFLFDQSFLEKK
ncbi:hypothetical protein GINT2_002234 [Glugoides intestinalis]